MNLIKNPPLRTGVLLLALVASSASGAVTFETLYSFGHNTNDSGSSPVGLTQGAAGDFYGTTVSGGTNGFGTIFRISTNGALTTLAAFNGTNGLQPVGQLVQGTNGTFYGATVYGGTNGGYGAAFKVTTNGVLTSLVSFTNDGINGYNPSAGLVPGTNGLLYGTTYYGGTNGGYGTIFAMTTDGAVTTLVSFNYTNGNYPIAALVPGADGNLYGTTAYGGTNGGYGTIFQVTTSGGLTTLHSFTYANNEGYYPSAPLIQGADGLLYGTTLYGGTNGGYGTLFKITTNGLFTNLHSFDYYDGAYPGNLVQASDGVLYGTTASGGTNGNGAIFKITTNGVFTRLHSLDYYEGYQPIGLVQASDGNLYGVTASGGTNGYGTVFRATTNGTLTTLYSFDSSSSTDGAQPDKPVQGAGGLFYGTTEYGGAYGYGTLYAITTNGLRKGLYSFTGADDGSQPNHLAQARDGFFYGTTASGGTNGDGTIFKVTTNGILTTLYTFNGDDGNVPNKLLQSLDGNLYGTTYSGGEEYNGTIFKLTTNGSLTTLHSFRYEEGVEPTGLMQRNDGNFYVTAAEGGTNGAGAIFIMTPSGALTTFYSFNYEDGAMANSLVQGLDGNLYGTTYSGGMYGSGTIFKATTNGTLTTLHSFNYDDGTEPNGLVQGSDGNFYGTTLEGGTNGGGTLFKMKPNGILTTLHSFSYGDGSQPNGLIQGKDHNFYGTTLSGGANGPGTFFRLNVPAAPWIVTQPASVTCLEGISATFTVEAEGALPLRYQWQKNSVNLSNGDNVSGATSSALTLNNLSLADTGIYSVVITNNFGSVVSSNATLMVLPSLAEALDATNLVWTTGGDADWFGLLWTSHDGVDAGRSGILIDAQLSWMETTVTGPGILTFWWKVSSEADYDSLFFLVNDEPWAAISGEADWQQKTFSLDAGNQTVSWIYDKDFSVSLGEDCGWVDHVRFVPAAAVPVVHYVFQTNHTFSMTWNTLPDAMYQTQYSTNLVQTNWFNLGAPGTNGSLSLPIGSDPQRFYRILLLP